jgi:F-type H+-transporting ATPase subunit epsilon
LVPLLGGADFGLSIEENSANRKSKIQNPKSINRMADKTFHIEIVTPRGMVYQGEVVSATIPGVVSPFQVLYHHAPILTELETGDIIVVDGANRTYHFATSGGFAEMKNNRLTVIAETVEPAGEIDTDRAERARQRAEQRVRDARVTHDAEIDAMRAEAALARAVNRLKVATYGGVSAGARL